MKQKTFGKLVLMLIAVFSFLPAEAGEDTGVKQKSMRPKKFSDITIHDLERTERILDQDFQGFEESDSRLLHMQTDVRPEIVELTSPRKHNMVDRKLE